MAERKMVDADGHIREIESDVLNTSRSTTRAVVMPYFTSRYCPTTVGTARRAAEEWAHRF